METMNQNETRTAIQNPRTKGIVAALSSALFLGMMPIYGKQAILLGLSPYLVVAIRTLFATLIMLVFVILFYRQSLYIYPAGLIGCLLAGSINGLGSLFYYSALARIDASVGHILYSLYPLFLVLWFFIDRQPPSRITVLRIVIAIPAVYLLTQSGSGIVDLIGVVQMLIASALYALHIPINQRVLYDMPAQTVTLYTLFAMSSIVVPVCLFTNAYSGIVWDMAWIPLFSLTLVTFLSRLTLFVGVKHLGGLQTALLGLGEMFVAVAFSMIWLGEKLVMRQWIGAILLAISLLLVGIDRSPISINHGSYWLGWVRPPSVNKNYPERSFK